MGRHRNRKSVVRSKIVSLKAELKKEKRKNNSCHICGPLLVFIIKDALKAPQGDGEVLIWGGSLVT